MIIKHVKDFKGELIPRETARKIKGQWYQEGKTCILMSDGQWHRITSNSKIIFDWESKKYVFRADMKKIVEGLVDDGTFGYFEYDPYKNVKIFFKSTETIKSYYYDPLNSLSIPIIKETNGNLWNKTVYYARTESIALKYGYIEAIYDGNFYKKIDANKDELIKFNIKRTPAEEKSNTYSILDDKKLLDNLNENFIKNNLVIENSISELSKLIPFSFGVELETSCGFVPARIRSYLGFTALRDGSLDGIEYTSIPFKGKKGLQAIKNFSIEASKRCTLNEKCSLHIHFGNVRTDKLYILSLWNLIQKIQSELIKYFPYSRTNSIRSDGKIYCKPLPMLPIDFNLITSSNNKKILSERVYVEFNKIYSWLNNGVPLGEIYDTDIKKVISFKNDTYKWKFIETNYAYTVKSAKHSINGNKWDKVVRYHLINFLCTFFSPAKTIEFRIHEATLNYNKIFSYMLICNAILQYANNIRLCFSKDEVLLTDIIRNTYNKSVSDYLEDYLKLRHKTFFYNNKFISDWKSIEQNWYNNEENFLINNKTILDVL